MFVIEFRSNLCTDIFTLMCNVRLHDRGITLRLSHVQNVYQYVRMFVLTTTRTTFSAYHRLCRYPYSFVCLYFNIEIRVSRPRKSNVILQKIYPSVEIAHSFPLSKELLFIKIYNLKEYSESCSSYQVCP